MIIGISFEFEGSYDNTLSKIFDNINVSKYTWDIEYEEILHSDGNNQISSSLFNYQKIVRGDNFDNYINNGTYLVYLADIKAFSDEDSVVQIDNYLEFSRSKCEMALLCADTRWYDFYAKETSIIDLVLSNCKRYNFLNVNVITDDNQIRTQFSVM